MVKAKAGSGETMNENEVIQNGKYVAARDRIVEKWLHEEVLPVYDSIASGRSSSVPADEAWARIAAHIGRREKRRVSSNHGS